MITHTHEVEINVMLFPIDESKLIGKAFDIFPDIRNDLADMGLKCEMPTGSVHKFRLHRMGVTLFFEASLDDGFVAQIIALGALAPGKHVHIHDIPSGNLSHQHETEARDGEVTPLELFTKMTEWFVSEVGKRIPMYRLATKK